ncbi:trypsin-like peptidase domain-containing protein [Nonomuraea sp. NPDC050153]|uniref:VMAP-C domain-containing protein n=1 Tax=Nonomuraea sp. NPDC050153 TaxID=3364359 RepID=UPI0037B2E4E3
MALLDRCAVAVCGHDGGPLRGTGFLITPRHVLTCAHVLGALEATTEEAKLDLVQEGRGEVLTGTVRQVLPPGKGPEGMWAMPDLAVVEIDGDPGERPCAWIGFGLPDLDDHHRLASCADNYRPAEYGRARLRLTHPSSTVVDDFDEYELRIKMVEVTEGCSGSPVIHLKSGAVRGVMKTTRRPNDDLGGLAVSLLQLARLRPGLYRRIWRENIRFHASDPAWTRERAEQLGKRARAEADLLILLAGQPPPDDPAGLLARANPARAEPDLVRDYWDIAHHVFADDAGRDLHPVLGLIKELLPILGQGERDRLLECGALWAEIVDQERAWRIALRSAAAEPPPEEAAAVAVHVGLDLQARQAGAPLYRYAIAESAGHRPDRNPVALRRGELEQELKKDLRGPMTRLGRTLGEPKVYLNLPGELLDLGVEEWTGLVEQQKDMPLGTRFPIIVRDHTSARGFRNWRDTRWNALKDALPLPLHQIGCRHELVAYSDSRRRGWFSARIGERAGLMLACGSDDLLRCAIGFGVPVALWWRSPCPGPEQSPEAEPCPGAVRMGRLTAELAHVRLAALPEKVRELRGEAQGDEAGHCGAGLVLLFDDPFAADYLRFEYEAFHSS